jgi:two-component system chemotaxis response regulator CheB
MPNMPEHALRAARPDYVVAAEEIPMVLAQIMRRPSSPRAGIAVTAGARDVAERGSRLLNDPRDQPPGPASGVTCPDCGGALWEGHDGATDGYRCHVGHRYTADSLVAAQDGRVERAFWVSLRVLEEAIALQHRLQTSANARKLPILAQASAKKAKTLEAQAATIRRVLGLSDMPPRSRGRRSKPAAAARK